VHALGRFPWPVLQSPGAVYDGVDLAQERQPFFYGYGFGDIEPYMRDWAKSCSRRMTAKADYFMPFQGKPRREGRSNQAAAADDEDAQGDLL
jgi:hypothetical protein